MSSENLAIYLNDHLAGSISALELLDHMIESGGDGSHKTFLIELKGEIEEDQEVLRGLVALHGDESIVRKAAGWLAEKAGRAKLAFDGPADSPLARFQALEGLGLGITGKLGLWTALAESGVPVGETDLANLQQRAADQIARVEARRLALAGEALQPTNEA